MADEQVMQANEVVETVPGKTSTVQFIVQGLPAQHPILSLLIRRFPLTSFPQKSGI